MRYDKSQLEKILFKYNYNKDKYQTLRVNSRGRASEMPKKLNSLYKNLIHISEKKVSHGISKGQQYFYRI